MTTFLVDTNLIVRFITGAPSAQAAAAANLFKQADAGAVILQIDPLVIAESVFVLTGRVYGHPRQAVADALIPFLQAPSLKVEKRTILLDALALFRDFKIDFADAYLAATARATHATVASFDRDFAAIPELDHHNPPLES